jgi:hypothetical protein
MSTGKTYTRPCFETEGVVECIGNELREALRKARERDD